MVVQERVARLQELYLRGLEDFLALQLLLGCQNLQCPLLQLASASPCLCRRGWPSCRRCI